MYVCTTVVTAITLCTYQVLAFNVGKGRETYGIKAPAIAGNETFERMYRVQMNTLEQLPFFLPSLWLFAMHVSDGFASLLGLAWVSGRIIYAHDYYEDAAKRGKGFMISFFAAIILLLGGVIGALVHG